MTRILDWVYRVCGALAALFLVSIVILILVQVIGRMIGVQVRDTDILSGFALAASSFLALAYTLRSGGHIRVSLLVSRLHGRVRRIVEGWCILFAIIAIGYFVWFTFRMVVTSYKFGAVSQGMIGFPLWVPQVGMLIGVALLEVAFIEEFVLFVKGHEQTYDKNDSGDFVE